MPKEASSLLTEYPPHKGGDDLLQRMVFEANAELLQEGSADSFRC